MSPLPKQMEEKIKIEERVISTSPIPKPPQEDKKPTVVMMDFSQAIKEVISGKKIHKLEWISIEYYGFLNDNILSLHKPDGKTYQWILSEGDLMGVDWVVIQ